MECRHGRFGSRLCKNVDVVLLTPYDSSVLWREGRMKRFVEGVDRRQSTLFPDRLEDWIGDDNPVQVIDVFVAAAPTSRRPTSVAPI